MCLSPLQQQSRELVMVHLALPGTNCSLHSCQTLWHLQLLPKRHLGTEEPSPACKAWQGSFVEQIRMKVLHMSIGF